MIDDQIENHSSLQHFLGLANQQRSPDAKTFWALRNQLSELNLVETLFNQFSKQLNKAGFLARKGQIIDASIVPAPVQRNTRDENIRIKQGDVPDDWDDNKRHQKDTDTCWTKKNDKITMDTRTILKLITTDAY